MEATARTPKTRFGAFELDLRSGRLYKGGTRLKLQDQPFHVLATLLERPGEVVTREELRQKLWPADTFVDFDTGLNSAVKKLRDVLNDSANQPRYIETFPRRGYRFIAEVKNEAGAPTQVPVPVDSIQSLESSTESAVAELTVRGTAAFQRRSRWRFWLTGILLGLGVAIIFGFNVRRLRAPVIDSAPIKSIAVLPLENLSGDPAEEYFSDGMTDALITELAQIRNLKVISRTSVMRYKGARKKLPEIARELQVDAVVEGTVEHNGNKVKITAQLIRAATDTHIWAASYSRVQHDLMGLQTEVAEEIAKHISKELAPGERGGASKVDPEAYEAYLKGIFYGGKFTPEGIRTGLRFYQMAIGKDPNYAAAYAEEAGCYIVLSGLGEMSVAEAYRNAREAAEKAILLDESLARGHESVAAIAAGYDWDWSKAEREYARAIDLNPNAASAHLGYANVLLLMGKPKEAMEELRRARELDPISLGMYVVLVNQLYSTREFDQALFEARKGLELYPDAPILHSMVSGIYIKTGQPRLAAETALKAEEYWGASPDRVTALRHAYETGGLKGLLGARIELNRKSAGQLDAYAIASDYALLGDKDHTLNWLDRLYRARDLRFPYTKTGPVFESVQADPRFVALMKRSGL